VGGHWPAEFRRTGLDGLVIRGRADRPVYLYVTAGGLEFRDASHVWGRDTYEVEKALRPEVGDKARIATIGQAGERCVLIASIVFDPPNTRVAARGGPGAVMGSKNLKAIVVVGDPANRMPIARPDELKNLVRTGAEDLKKNTAGLHNFGTSGGVVTVESFGDLPIKNWQLGAWKEGAQAITGQTIQPKWLDHHYACFACPIRCGKIYKHEGLGLYGHGPEYETLGMLGANCLNADAESILVGNEWCNRYGFDTISGGAVVAFGLEAYERGLISREDCGGTQLAWDGASMVALVHKIGRGEDVGVLLGQGVRKAAEALGPLAVELAVHTKGLEYPAHDPRGHVSMALNYATAVRGACHLEALTYFLDRGITCPDLGFTQATNPHTSADKPPIVKKMQDYLSVFNPLGMCKFLFIGRVGPSLVAKWLSAYAGWDTDMDEVMRAGERLFNLKRLYNVRLGVSRKDDVLPPRLYAGAKPDGFAKGVLPDMGNMLHAYYELRKWTPEGIPSEDKLNELGL
jgi:aldehyde:ferredoxin oxidoreductase